MGILQLLHSGQIKVAATHEMLEYDHIQSLPHQPPSAPEIACLRTFCSNLGADKRHSHSGGRGCREPCSCSNGDRRGTAITATAAGACVVGGVGSTGTVQIASSRMPMEMLMVILVIPYPPLTMDVPPVLGARCGQMS